MAGHSFLTKLISRVNVITKFFLDPCDAPVTVYLETLFPALMDMLVDLFAFDVTEYSQQKGISIRYPKDKKGKSKARRGRKGGGRHKRWWIIEALTSDPGEILGKKHARDFGGAQRVLTGGRAHFWILGAFAQRFAFWLWFIVRLSEFFMDWWNGLITAGYCEERGTPVLYCVEEVDGAGAILGWTSVNFWTVVKQRGNITWNVASGISREYDLTVVFACAVRTLTPDVAQTNNFRIRVVGPSGAAKNIATTSVVVSTGDLKTVGMHGVVPKNHFFAVESLTDYGFAELIDCKLHAFGPNKGKFDGLLRLPRDERGQRV